MSATINVSLLALLATTSLVACVDLSDEDLEADHLASHEQHSCVHDDLAKLRELTERYRDIKNALKDGYKLGVRGQAEGCVAHPTDGAMGYHYFREDRFDDVRIKELKPEALVYHTGPDGKLVLGAVEWVVPKAAWEAEHGVNADPPKVYGHELHVINPVLNWYLAHAWIWKKNPSGTFADWNPNVTCP